MSRIYRRTIEGWRLEGNDAGVMPAADQSDAWDALTIPEQDRIAALFEASLPEEDAVIDVLPGEQVYERWKQSRNSYAA